MRFVWRKLFIPGVLAIPAAVMAHIDMRIAFDGKQDVLWYVLAAYLVAVGVLGLFIYQLRHESSVREIFRQGCNWFAFAAFAMPVGTIILIIISPVSDPIIPPFLVFVGALVGGIVLGLAAVGIGHVVGE